MSSKKAGTINLATVRYFTGVVPQNGVFSIEMLSDDISASTAWNLQFSSGGVNFDNAQEAGVDITDTLVVDEPMYQSFNGIPGDYIKILFAGATTGSVDYVINAV